jgi:hypothetical protein
MAATVRQIQGHYGRMSEEEEARLQAEHIENLKHWAQSMLDTIDELRKEGKGLEWDPEKKALVICDTPGLNTRFQEVEAPEQPAKRTRGPRRPATPIVAKDAETVNLRSDILNQELIRALRSSEGYQHYPDQGIAEASKKMGKKQEGRLIITIRPLENEGLDTVLAALNTLGDSCVDTYMALMAIALDRNGTENIRLSFFVSPDDILGVCGKKKTNGSFTPVQRADVTAHLKALSQARIIATIPMPASKRRKPTVLRAEGAIIDILSAKIGEYSTITGEPIWENISVALGQWITMIPELNQTTATMLRQVLAYSAKNERYQKRIGAYLTFMFRNNAKRGCMFICSMQKLLEGSGIKPERQVGRFKDAIEHALADLQRDGVIGKYAPIVDASPEVEQHANGWWDIYSRTQWRFEAPDGIKRQYRSLLKEGNFPE